MCKEGKGKGNKRMNEACIDKKELHQVSGKLIIHDKHSTRINTSYMEKETKTPK